MDRSSTTALARDVTAVARESGISVKAAGLAYHTFNTFVPLVILLLVGVSATGSMDAIFEVFESATGLETMASRDELDRLTGDGGDRLRAALLALAIFVWSAIRLFQATNSAFTGVYGTRKRQSVFGVAVTLALIVVTVTGGVTLVAVVGVALGFFADEIGWTLLSPPLLFGSLVVGFLPMYYFIPHAAVTLREVLPGTVLAAGGWTLLAIGFRIYVVTSGSVALFGIAGAVLIGLTWVYLGGFCLVLGAVLNAVHADRVEADDDWVPLQERVA